MESLNALLYEFCQQGQTQKVSLLLEISVDVNAKQADGSTPLHAAASNGHLECLKLLLAKILDTEVATAKSKGMWSEPNFEDRWAVRACRSIQDQVNTRNNRGETALYAAAANGHAECIKALSANSVTTEITFFGQAMDTPFADANITGPWKQTPLHIAAHGGHSECVRLLLQPAGLAVTSAELMLSQNVNVNSKDAFGRTALHIAAEEGHVDCVKELLAGLADVSSRNDDDLSPLHYACIKGHIDCLKLLLEKAVYVNGQDHYGRTVLHVAAEYGHVDCVRELLAKGVDINIKDRAGLTALDRASKNKRTECVQLLEQAKSVWEAQTALDRLSVVSPQRSNPSYSLQMTNDGQLIINIFSPGTVSLDGGILAKLSS